MPNVPPLLTARDSKAHGTKIVEAAGNPDFHLLSSVMLVDRTRPSEVQEWYDADIVAAKDYPGGVTTGSAGGVTDQMRLRDVFAEMEQAGIILPIHAEMPGVDPQIAEQAFLPTLRKILNLPHRPVVIIEHVSTIETIRLVNEYDRVYGTITPHHMIQTWADIYDASGKIIYPHNWCKPPAKTRVDRAAIVRAALDSRGKFFYVTDFAPHLTSAKMSDSPMAGCANLPAGLVRVVEVFDHYGCLDLIEDFTSTFAARVYGLKLSEHTLTLKRVTEGIPCTVPRHVHIAGGQFLAFWQGGEPISWYRAA